MNFLLISCLGVHFNQISLGFKYEVKCITQLTCLERLNPAMTLLDFRFSKKKSDSSSTHFRKVTLLFMFATH